MRFLLPLLVCLLLSPGCSDDATGTEPDGAVTPDASALDAGTGVDAASDADVPDATLDADAPDGALPDPGVPEIHPTDPHRFAMNGSVWWPAGYYPGAAFNMTGDDYNGDYDGYNQAFIDLAAQQGINLFRIWINWGNLGNGSGWDNHILHPYLRTGPGTANDGDPKLDLDQFNPDYFDLIERSVEYARQQGMVVQVLLLDCWHAGYGESYGFYDLDYFSGANNVNGVDFTTEAQWLDPSGTIFSYNAAFVEHVVETIGDKPNIIWETCNEKRAGSPPDDPDVWAQDPFHAGMAAVIRARESALAYPAHLIMPVDLPEHRTVAGHRTPTNGLPNAESLDDMHDRLATVQFGWNRPLISDNDCCAGEPDAVFVRRKAWLALTAGAQVDLFNNEGYLSAVLANQNTADGMRWVALTRTFIDDLGVNLVGMVPLDSAVDGGATAYGRAGQEYVIYQRTGAAFTVTGLPSALTATWFNPRNGTTQAAGSGPTFTPPTTADWVLYVVAAP